MQQSQCILHIPLITTSFSHHFPLSPHSLRHHFPKSPHSLPHHFPSSPLPLVTTSQSHHTPFVTTSQIHHTSLRNHFPSSPLPLVTTSQSHHTPFVTTSQIHHTSLPHHFPSSPLPWCLITTSLPHHFPSSPLPFVTTSLSHHFLSSPLPIVTTLPSSPCPFVTTSLSHHTLFVTTSLSHHAPFVSNSLRPHFPSSPLSFVTMPLGHHCASSPHCVTAYSFLVMYCYVMSSLTPPFINVKSHNSILSVTRKIASQLPLIIYFKLDHITDLVLGFRSVGFRSGGFLRKSQMSQRRLNWAILSLVQVDNSKSLIRDQKPAQLLACTSISIFLDLVVMVVKFQSSNCQFQCQFSPTHGRRAGCLCWDWKRCGWFTYIYIYLFISIAKMKICRSTLQQKMSDFNSKHSSYRTLQRKNGLWLASNGKKSWPPRKHIAQNCSNNGRTPPRKSCSKLLAMAQASPKKLLKIARNGTNLPEKIAQNFSKLLKMAQASPRKLLKIARNDPNWPEKIAQFFSILLKIAQFCSKLLKIAQFCSKLLKIAQNVSKCLEMSQNVSKCLKMSQKVSKGFKRGQEESKGLCVCARKNFFLPMWIVTCHNAFAECEPLGSKPVSIFTLICQPIQLSRSISSASPQAVWTW